MSYYAEQNGWVDNGKKLHNNPCPNCGSSSFIETVSREYCPSCGLECNYWGGGINAVYKDMMSRKAVEYKRIREEEFRLEFGEE